MMWMHGHLKDIEPLHLHTKSQRTMRRSISTTLTILGFVAIIDPVREESPEAIQKAQQAGIKVVMITGDHPNTALCIAKELGIATSDASVMSEKELAAWEDNGENAEELKDITVFSRVTPEQKMKIVMAYQSLRTLCRSHRRWRQ